MNAPTFTLVFAVSLLAFTAGCSTDLSNDSSATVRLQAIAAGRDFLLARQQDDGSWETAPEDFPGGSTAMAVWALLESGSSPDDPALQKALAYLRDVTSDKTYTVAVRANAYQAATAKGASAFRQPLEKEVRRLVGGSVKGAYTYVVEPKVEDISDQSNSHYAAMGVEAGLQTGQDVPAEFWKQVMRYWVRTQNPDGGWPYSQQGTPSTPTMTAAAVATLGLCHKQLGGENPQAQSAIDRGIRWLAPRFEESLTNSSVAYYYLLTLDRMELLTGHRRINGCGGRSPTAAGKAVGDATSPPPTRCWCWRGRNSARPAADLRETYRPGQKRMRHPGVTCATGADTRKGVRAPYTST
ncbi:MAG: prenyltransferase/squalene oxidase repeat-containing protein [Phycisphaerae bacterium]